MSIDGTLPNTLAYLDVLQWLSGAYLWAKVLIGFSIIIFVHELGHFLCAKWMGVRVDRFAVGFFTRIVGYRKGEGVTFGKRPEYTAEQLKAKGYGETDYCLNVLPFGGYVKMLGQDDILVNEETGEMKTGDDPRSFTNKSVGRRMVVVSGGVVFNVLFAILVFAAVYLAVGKDVLAPRVGVVEPESAAMRAGLQPGDRFLDIDGHPVQSFQDVMMASVLGGRTMDARVQRDGKVLDLTLKRDVEDGKKAPLGVSPVMVAQVPPHAQPAPWDGLRPGDTITGVDGKKVVVGTDVQVAFMGSRGRPLQLTVERKDPNDPHQTIEQQVTQIPTLQLAAAKMGDPSDVSVANSRNLLGLQRRQMILQVEPGMPAAKAGMRAGDVIAQWGNVPNPLYADITASIHAHEAQPIPVVVEREGKAIELSVTPEAPLTLFGEGEPKVGVAFIGEDRHAVVAGVVDGTPAAALGIPRGSEIVAIDDTPVATWSDVYETLRKAAGGTVHVRYHVAGEEIAGEMSVPSSVVDALDLPPTAIITSIDGKDSVRMPSGKTVPLTQDPAAVRQALERNVGQTVTVEYMPSLIDPRLVRRTFDVTEANVDPWQLRGAYSCPILGFAPETVRISANGNPLTATWMGLSETGGVLRSVYEVIQGMIVNVVSPSSAAGVGVENVAGPVGIFRMAGQSAEAGLSELLVFLAIISVNLAVINFLPFPVVDGGLMVFLILEKIRGKPMSLKVQMTTTLIGLALIVGIFLLVTFQDITRIWGG